MNNGPNISAGDLLFVLSRRKWQALLVFCASIFAAVVYLFIVRDDTFIATAKVMVRVGYEQEPPPHLSETPSRMIGYRFQDVAPELDLLTSHHIIDRVVEQFHLDQPPVQAPPKTPLKRIRFEAKQAVKSIKLWAKGVMIAAGLQEPLSPKEEAVEFVKKSFMATPQKDSNVIKVALGGPTRLGTADVLNAWLDHYQRFRLELYRDRTGVKFFEGEVSSLGGKLAEYQNKLRDFDTSRDVSAFDKQQEAYLTQVAAQESALREAEIAKDSAASALQGLDANAGGDTDYSAIGNSVTDPITSALVVDLSTLQNEREKLRLTELDTNPRIRNNRAQFSGAYGTLRSHLAAILRERKEAVDSRTRILAGLKSSLARLHAAQPEYATMKRAINATEASYNFYSNKLLEARSKAELERGGTGNVLIVERAIDPVAPNGLRKIELLAIALAGCLTLALAWISIAEFLDDGIYAASEMEYLLDAPVIALIER